MLFFIARRLLAGITVLFVISSAAYFLLFASGANIARSLMGEFATEEQVAARAQQLGLDRPIPERYLEWLGGALTGDFGKSWFSGSAVADAVIARLPVTFSIVIVAVILIAVLAAALGTAAAVYRGWIDRAVQVGAIVGDAIPNFIIAVILVTVLGVQLRIFPATGFVPIDTDPWRWALSITLPVVALLVSTVTTSAQQVRGAMLSTLDREFIRTLRSRGLGEGEIVLRHALRSAAPAGLTVLSLQFVALLSGNVVIERIFALPGVGSLAVQATSEGDIPIVMGVVVFAVLVVVLVNLAVDILNGWLNPKARVS